MTIFRLKQHSTHPRSIGGGVIRWDYDRAELIADGVVHVLGIAFGLIAATALVIFTAMYASTKEIVSVSVYVAGLLAIELHGLRQVLGGQRRDLQFQHTRALRAAIT